VNDVHDDHDGTDGWTVPVAERRFPDARRNEVKAMLTARVRPRRPGWTRPVVAVAGVALVGTGVAATGYVVYRAPSVKTQVRCYSAATADVAYSTTLVVAAPVRPGERTSRSVPIRDAVGACAQQWRDRILIRNRPVAATVPDPGARAAVPPLVACTLPRGDVGVYPGDADTCRSLRLPNTTR